MAGQPIVQGIVDRLHVSCSNRDVIRAVWDALTPEARKPHRRKDRKEYYKVAIKRHAQNRDLYTSVMFGRF